LNLLENRAPDDGLELNLCEAARGTDLLDDIRDMDRLMSGRVPDKLERKRNVTVRDDGDIG